jgi:hypothetical protein
VRAVAAIRVIYLTMDHFLAANAGAIMAWRFASY